MSKNLDSKSRDSVPFYCNRELSKISDSKSALARPFPAVNLSSPNNLQLYLRGYFDFQGGYARHSREVAFRIDDDGRFNIRIEPLPTPVDIEPLAWQRISSLTKTPNFDVRNCIHLTISGPGYAQKEFTTEDRIAKLAKQKIIWTMVENHPATTQKRIGEWLKNVDEVWVPTTADIKRFESVGIKSKLVPIGVDLTEYNSAVRRLAIPQLKGKFVFGVFGTWNKRKGIKEIIRAFCKAFTKKDNVALFMNCKYGTRPYDEDAYEDNRRNPENIKDIEEKKAESNKWCIEYEFNRYIKDLDKKNLPQITLFDVPIQEAIMPNMMRVAHVTVGFSAGESTWLPGLESLALEIPVIQLASECSGFMDYLNRANALLCTDVKYVEADKELYEGTSEYYKGCKFAQGNEDELASIMKEAYCNIRKHKTKTRNCVYDVLKNRNWSHIVGNVINSLLNKNVN